GVAAVRAQRRAQRHGAPGVDVQPGVAELSANPGAVPALPADEAAERGLGLVPAAAAPAPVVLLAAVAHETAVHQAVAAPAQARGQRRPDAVVAVAVAVALEVAAQVGPPAPALLAGQRRQLGADPLGAAAPGHRRRPRQHRELARAFDLG